MIRHGEFKSPGGKLVVVDFRIHDGQLVEVQVSGDFFLFPDHAIHDISASLNGTPIALGKDEFTRRCRAALAGAEMLGFAPEDIAEAIARALA